MDISDETLKDLLDRIVILQDELLAVQRKTEKIAPHLAEPRASKDGEKIS